MYLKFPLLQDKELLEAEVKIKSLHQIAEEIGSSYSALAYAVRRWEIVVPKRTTHRIPKGYSESIKAGLRKKYPKGRYGAVSSNWKGGISTLAHLIRTSTPYKNWQKEVRERDSYTCQDCGKHGGWLEVDHLKQFAQILIDNKITSIEDALKCEELWNTKNGLTRCNPCHRKTANYSQKPKRK